MSKRLRRWVRIVGGSITPSTARNLSRSEAESVFASLLSGDGSDSQVAAFFTAMRAKGCSADELVGFALAARARIDFPRLPAGGVVVATTRLGKLHSPPLGLAAAAAAAAAGVPVLLQAAPHAEGGGPTLGDLWMRIVGKECCEAEQVEADACKGLSCWCPTHFDHGWERLLRIEEEVGLRSVPDQVSKLLAPDGAAILVPAMPGPVLGMACEALGEIGHRNCIVLQGKEGSIDPSCVEQTRGLELDGGVQCLVRIRPEDFALDFPHEPRQMHEDRLEAALESTLRALMGTRGPERSVTLLGAALILRLGRRCTDLASGVALAEEAIESGAAHRMLFDVPSR